MILSTKLTNDILVHLGIMAVPQTPSIPFIDSLIHAYCRTVPWESAFRIVRRAAVTNPTNCPRWPDQFWREAIQKGSGGTCFESNYAVLTLLQALGIDGYLTINNMEDSIGCHSAIIIWLAGQKWLVDVGFPLYAPLPISPHGTMYRSSEFL
ncbi:MAG: hypothetical protein GY796_16490, partial [Chloroflexi bacterium]|nr:hypothetical protein [Chloroflexota bacterium]